MDFISDIAQTNKIDINFWSEPDWSFKCTQDYHSLECWVKNLADNNFIIIIISPRNRLQKKYQSLFSGKNKKKVPSNCLNLPKCGNG